MPSIYALVEKGSREIRYVGQTVNPFRQRLSAHKREAKRGEPGYKNNWIRSIGPDNLDGFVLEDIPTSDRDLLDFREQFWIAAVREAGYCLVNRTDGGTGKTFLGMVHTEEQKRKWSEARKGNITGPLNPNYGKFGEAHPSYGRKLSDETKAQLSEQKKGAKNPNYGKIYTDEERKAMSEKTKGRPMPSSRKSAHTRHHTNKGISRPETCGYCAGTIE